MDTESFKLALSVVSALVSGSSAVVAYRTRKQTVRSLRVKDWSEQQVRQSSYSESSLLELRRRTLQEQIVAKTIQAEAHAVLLAEAEEELTKLKVDSAPSAETKSP
jgi:hypothetical protein